MSTTAQYCGQQQTIDYKIDFGLLIMCMDRGTSTQDRVITDMQVCAYTQWTDRPVQQHVHDSFLLGWLSAV